MRLPPIHPFLFGLYPVLFQCGRPASLPSQEVVASVLVIECTVALLWLAIWAGLGRDIARAGVWVSFFICMFFGYWAVHDVVSRWVLEDSSRIRHYIFIVMWLILVIIGSVYLARFGVALAKASKKLDLLAFALIGIAASGAWFNWVQPIDPLEWAREPILDNEMHDPQQIGQRGPKDGKALPNIYYIILDAYGRSDVLRDIYGYNNDPWLEELSRKGFYVAAKGKTNYCQTLLSLASSLNVCYLDGLDPIAEDGRASTDLLVQMIANNRVSHLLSQWGYRTIAFSSGYPATEMTKSDLYLTPPGIAWRLINSRVVGMTPLNVVQNWLLPRIGNDIHRNRLSYQYDKLGEISNEKGPFFVFCHIIAPHPPFVFDETGEAAQTNRPFSLYDGSHFHHMDKPLQREYKNGYRRQIPFINRKILMAVDKIKANSGEPPIIIIQGDHGPGFMLDWGNQNNVDFRERMSILNAVLLPKEAQNHLYPEITPVNTFRLIFRHCFGVPWELLPDRSYFSPYSDPFKLTDVTEKIQ